MEEIYANVEYDKSVHSRSSTNQTGPRSSERRFYRAAVLCLGLLSVFLLVGLIILGVHYHNSERGAAAELSTVKANMTELLQDSEKEVSSLTGEKNQLKTSLSSLTAERNQLKTSLSSLTAERDQLKTGLSSLTAERDQLKTSLSSLTREKDQLDARLTEMTKDRDRLESLSRKSCPAGWTMFSWSCYLLSSRSDSWTNGRSDCQNKGADLVIINSKEEQDFLSGFSNVDIWIGLSDRDEEGKWKWVDGTRLTLMYWNVGEPNNKAAGSGEDCAQMEVHKGHKWNDLSCDKTLRWICEKSA